MQQWQPVEDQRSEELPGLLLLLLWEGRDTEQRGSHPTDAAVLCFLFCFPFVTQSWPIFLSAGPVLGECVSLAGPAGSRPGMGTDATVTLKTLQAWSGNRGHKEIKIFQMHPNKQVHRNSSRTIC